MAEERLQLRAEDEAARRGRVVHRLDAEAIAGDEELVALAIPDGEAEHAGERVDAGGAALFVEVHDGFGVAGGLERVAARQEAFTQRAVVVNLAVEDDPVAPIAAGDRLLAARQIDDREAAHADGAALVDVLPILVGAAMVDGAIHRVERGAGALGIADVTGGGDEAVDAAHD